LFEYALSSLKRRGAKNIFILIIFFILIFLLSCVFFISNSIKYELNLTLKSLPDIVMQKLQAGRVQNINTDRISKIANIPGVSEVTYKKSIQKIVNKFDKKIFDKSDTMIVGDGVKKILEKNYYNKYFDFIEPNGGFKKVYIAGTFKGATSLESNDIILLSNKNARKIFGMKNNEATDITLRVPNPKEVAKIASKLELMYPDSRMITKNDLRISYNNIFDYKSGIFLAMFIIVLFTFFIIIYDKASGLSSDEKREIGVQKAVGWKIGDVILQKFYEASIISVVSFLLAIMFAIFYVYILDAPLIRDIFTGYSILKPAFKLPFVVDFQTIILIFFATVPLYLAATIIPSWVAATLEADEVIR